MADLGNMRFLKRFPESKHDQILQVMSYLEMCGLSGRDLVSIGGFVDRRATSTRYKAAKQRVDDYIKHKTIVPIGKDGTGQMQNRFRYKGIDGDYVFSSDGWSDWKVTSVKTNDVKRFAVTDRIWPSHVHWTRRHFYSVIMDIAEGNIKLNF